MPRLPRYRASRKKNPTMDELTYENDLQSTLIQAATLHGYLHYHTYDSRRSPEGYLDLTIAGHEELIIWELKTQRGVLTGSQQAWLDELSRVKGPPLVEVIRPSDLDRCLALLARKGK